MVGLSAALNAVSRTIVHFGFTSLVSLHLVLSGKCYPCDTCHDAAEEHPAVWANRMLCGFCGLEQPFSSKPCSCGSQLAKSSSMTRFWEGGKGNRNTRALSKNDSKKSVFRLMSSTQVYVFIFLPRYAGLNKTISRRAGRLLVPKSK